MSRILRRKVFSARNSSFGVPLEWLDQQNWWTEDFGSLYLHVKGDPKADPANVYGVGECVYRVFCRASERPRLMLKDGVLYWLIDKP